MDTAVGAGLFKILVTLVQKAGLVEVLKGLARSPYSRPPTPRSPNSPKQLVDKIVADKALLTKVLTYHAIAAEVLSSSLKNGQTAKAVEGEPIKITIHGKHVSINKSRVIKADIKCKNGVIHVIDTVLVPPSLMNHPVGRTPFSPPIGPIPRTR